MKIWFSSDWHINHKNISGKNESSWSSGHRDFLSLNDMNENIINNINKYCSYDDIIYFIGDFCFGDSKLIPYWRSRILCNTIHFCKGNHDDKIDEYKNFFTSVQDVLSVKHGKHSFFLSHYSHRVWSGSHKGSIHLFGHSHGSIPDYGKSMDVGIDVAKKILGEYRPFSIEEVISIVDKKEVGLPDNHGKK